MDTGITAWHAVEGCEHKVRAMANNSTSTLLNLDRRTDRRGYRELERDVDSEMSQTRKHPWGQDHVSGLVQRRAVRARRSSTSIGHNPDKSNRFATIKNKKEVYTKM